MGRAEDAIQKARQRSLEALSERLEMDPAEVHEALKIAKGLVSLERPFGEDDDHNCPVVDLGDELIDFDRSAVRELADLLEQANRGAEVGWLKVADLKRHISSYIGDSKVGRGVLPPAVSRSENE